MEFQDFCTMKCFNNKNAYFLDYVLTITIRYFNNDLKKIKQ